MLALTDDGIHRPRIGMSLYLGISQVMPGICLHIYDQSAIVMVEELYRAK